MRLYRYCCGCIGFEPFDRRPSEYGSGEVANAYLVQSCDGESGVGLFFRDGVFTRQKYGDEQREISELSAKEVDEFAKEIGDLINDGYRMREVRRLFNP